MEASSEQALDDVFGRRTVERNTAGEQLIRGDTEGVEVRGEGQRLALDLLGRQVRERADEALGLRRAELL